MAPTTRARSPTISSRDAQSTPRRPAGKKKKKKKVRRAVAAIAAAIVAFPDG